MSDKNQDKTKHLKSRAVRKASKPQNKDGKYRLQGPDGIWIGADSVAPRNSREHRKDKNKINQQKKESTTDNQIVERNDESVANEPVFDLTKNESTQSQNLISKNKSENEVWQAYLKSKEKYREVYRYLAEN